MENNPPKHMRELKLNYTHVKRINPRIVMTSITPFGQTGPYKDYKGGELIVEHLGGIGYASAREVNIRKSQSNYPGIFSVFKPV